MLSFKNLCLGELELVGYGQAMSKKSIWEKGEGSLEDGAHQKVLEKRPFIAFHLIPRRRKSARGSCPPVFHTRSIRIPVYKADSHTFKYYSHSSL